ncbi:MAG: M60 family metallopeptidase [Kiritimatiellae bacterium]|nr:M60 family metallopeptidase [Kiritimatiellia bacterium]
MWNRIALGICLLCVGGVRAQDAEAFQKTVSEKAGGLEIVQGGVPGSILVAGKPAFPLALGHVSKVPLPIAAGSTLGKGRIVAVGHERFLSSEALTKPCNAAFIRASLDWLAGGSTPGTVYYDARCGMFKDLTSAFPGIRMQPIDRMEQLAEIAPPAVLLLNTEEHRVAEMTPVRAFIERGGGVFCTVVGWGWHQVSGGKSFKTQNAFNTLAGPAGLYTDGHAVDPMEAKRFADAVRLPKGMRCEEALDLAESGKDLKDDVARQVSFLITAFRQVLPDDEARYRPRIVKLMEDLQHAAIPSPEHPVTSGQVGNRLPLSVFQDGWLRDPVRVWPAHPAAKVYPGLPHADTPLISRSVWSDCAIPRWHGTRLFAVAGEPLTVTLPEGAEREGLRLRIGSTSCRVTAHARWLRAPVVDIEIPLTKRETTLSSPFGGLVYVTVPHGKSGKIQVKIGPACPAPWFVEGRDTPETWREKIRAFPAPMAEIENGKVVFSVPSSFIRELDDPLPLLKVWSEILDLDATLTAIPTARKSAERFCVDVQLCAGFMHAGYPIMIPAGSARHLMNAQTIRLGREENVWGFFHEMGHNHQYGDWTFDGAGEVTVNFFTLYCMDKICGLKPRQTRMGGAWVKRAYERWEAEGHPYAKWKSDPFLALEFFVRLHDRFGWEPFEKFFAEYRTLSPAERPKNDYEKRRQWAERFSRLTGEDLYPLFNLLRNPGEPEFKK